MEKLTNILNPGHKKDDEVLYGSGNVDGPVFTGNKNTVAGEGSHFGNSRTTGNDSLSSDTGYGNTTSHHPLSTSANPTSTTGYDNTTRNDPLSTSTNPTSTTGYDNTTRNDPLTTSTNPIGGSQYDTGVTGRSNDGLNDTSASRMPGGFGDDAATAASTSSGIPGQSQSRSGLTSTNDPALDSTTRTGSNLTGNEYPDRSVGSRGVGDQNYAPEEGRSFPLRGNSNTTSGSNYAPGQTGTYPVGGAIDSTTVGPHSLDLAKKTDPRVDYDLDGSRTVDTAGLGSGTGPIAGSANQGSLGRDPVLASGTAVGNDMTSRTRTGRGAGAGIGARIGAGAGVADAETWEHDHSRHGHTYEGDPCATGDATSATLHTDGPHATDTANRLDPHVATDGTTTGGHHHGHTGRDTALASGVGTGATAGAHEASRDTLGTTADTSTGSGLSSSNTDIVGTSSTGKTAGPHKSNLLNKLDPRVDSDLSKQQGSTDTTGIGLDGSSKDHRHGRDAGLTGVGGAATYEIEKHHRDNEPMGYTSGVSSSDPYNSTGLDHRVDSTGTGYGGTTDTTGAGKGHHLGRDTALGAGAGGLAYEAERAHGKPTQSSTIPSDTTGAAYDNTNAPTDSGYNQAGTALAGNGHQPAASYTDDNQPTKSNHLGRYAALGAGAGGAAYGAEQMHDTGRTDPGTQIREQAHQGASVATHPSPGYGNESAIHPSEGRAHGHRKEDAAISGGAGVGAGAVTDRELSQKDQKYLGKEQRKEEKAYEKEQVKHEKAIEKDERKHEKALEKEEKSEKKHGGLLGFLHRDKGDKNAKDDPLDQPQASGKVREGGAFDEEMSAPTGATTRGPLEDEHGTQSGFQDPPLESGVNSGVGSGTGMGHGITTHDAYGTEERPNKLHKDPPAKVLESRGFDQPGSGY